MIFLYIFIALIVIGAIVQTGVLFSFAIGFDAMVQDILWDDTLGVTISSRAGLAARAGRPGYAKVVNFIMRSPTHCEDAIVCDRERAKKALELLG